MLNPAKVVPVKKGNVLETSYRQLSRLSIFSNVFEKAFLVRLSSFTSDFNALPNDQFGFTEIH